jgi:hypothetical protein
LTQAKNSPKLDAFLSALRIITIINHSPDESAEERLSKDCGVDMKIVKSALGIVNIPQQSLVASKVDYYIFWLLMSGLIQSENEAVFLTERQKRIFEVTKRHNVGALGRTMISPNMPEYEKLTTIENADVSWASLEEIFEAVNKDGGEKISNTQIVGRELRELKEKKIIKDKNMPGSKNRLGYHVTTFDIGDKVSLPHPSEIEDPVLEKEKIKILNPITEEINEI